MGSDDTERPFADRSAACGDCMVDESNAIETMKLVLTGDKDPEDWYCEQHLRESLEEMQEWAENNGYRAIETGAEQ